MKILIVDDNTENGYLLEHLLHANGYDAVSVTNGAEALAELARDGYGLVISDVLMPEMDGFRLCREVKGDERFTHIPFVFYTATYTDESDRAFALSLGAERFLIKPAEPDAFVRAIGEVLRAREIGTLVAGPPPVQDDAKYLKRYNERLIQKLEEKMVQLEQANKALADSQMFLHTMIQSEPECVKLMGADGCVLTMNPAGLAMIQAESLADVRGKPLHTLIRPLHRAAFNALTEAVFRGEAGVLEFEIDGLKGAHRWLETHAVPLRGPDGDITLLGLTRDITERKRAEQEVKELTRDLEARVADRTAELIDANRELESFSYSVSHDLRAPLRVIDGFSKVLLDDYRDRLDEGAQDHLRRIRAAVERMGHLIDDLLDLSRVSRMSMRREPVDLSALAQSVATVLRATEPERAVEWVMAPGVTARGDYRLLRIALENLFGNAWKFTKRTERPRIEFGMSHDGDEAIYWVRDNGAGFDMAYADRLFTTFQRLHTADEFPGTGVGLAIVRRIIQRHGGRIWAEGAVGRGAVLSFMLNVHEES